MKRGARTVKNPTYDQISSLMNGDMPVFYRPRFAGDDVTLDWVSDNFTAATGLNPEAACDAAGFWRDQIHPDDREAWRGFLQRARQEGRADAEYRIRSDAAPDGMRITDRLARQADGTWLGRWRPVAPVDALERRCQLAEERFDAVTRTSPNVIYFARLDTGQILYANPSVERMFGITPEQATTMRTVDFFANSEDREAIAAEIRSNGYSHRRNVAVKDAGGKIIQVEASASLFVMNGTPHIVAELVDVTDIHASRAALEKSERRFRDFARIASDWVWETDADHRVTFVSERFFEQTGFPREFVLGKNPPDMMENPGWMPFSDEEKQQTIALSTARKPLRDVRYCLPTPAGRDRYVSLSGDPIFDDQGEFLGYRGVGSDITDRIETTQSLVQAKIEADQANTAKSKFLASMSHELRTPLNAILGFGQLIEFLQGDRLDPMVRENLGHILDSGRHLLALIEQLLDLERIERGAMEVDTTDVNLADLIGECLTLVAPQAARQQVTVVVEPAPGELAARADRLRLKQVLVNLIDNGIKYNRQRGTVSIILEPEEPGRIRISVKDTGQGIPLERQDQVFSEFARLGREAQDIQGAGIGLSLCRRLVEMMDGSIGFDSEPGKGSLFWVSVPRARDRSRPVPAMPPAMEETVQPRQRHHVLLCVEDNFANANLVRALTETMDGVRLVHAETAERGLEMAASCDPFLILMDLNLPGMDGYEALRALRNDSALCHIPVVAVSAHAFSSDIRQALAQGFDDYLTKPLDMKTFQSMVSRYMRQAPKPAP